MNRVARWTIGMTMLGLLTAAFVYAWTGSWWWAGVGLFGSGFVVNAIASGRPSTRQQRRSDR